MQHTIITERPAEETHSRHAVVNALAVVGFLALVFIGIVMAIYAARYVPATISRIAAGATYLSIDGADTDGDNQLEVVPTLPFPEEEQAPVATTTPAAPATPAAPGAPAVIGYRTVTTPYPTPGSIRVPLNGGVQNLYGDPNLTVTITGVGQMNGSRFVRDDSVSDNDEVAVQFRVSNEGTDETGAWKLTVTMPTKRDSTYEFNSSNQASLMPGGYIDYTIHLDKNDARVGDNQRITVEVDPADKVDESDERDNKDSETIDIDN